MYIGVRLLFGSREQEGGGWSEARRRIEEIMNSLNRQAAKLSFSLAKLRSFEEECFSKVVWHLRAGDLAEASIYASEVVYLRRLRAAIEEVKGLILQTGLRLNTLLDSQQLGDSLTTLVEGLRKIPFGLDAVELGLVTKVLCDVAASQRSAGKEVSRGVDAQSRDVLREAESKAYKGCSEPLTG